MSILRLWVIGAILIALLIGGLGWLLGIAPKLSEAAAADDERHGVESINEGYQATLLRLRELSENLPALKSDLDEMRVGIPEGPEINTLLGQLNELAARAGVDITSVVANPPRLVTTPEGGSSPITDFVAIPIEVGVAGPSGGLSQFIREVQFGPRLFFVSSINVKEDAETGQLTVAGLIYVLPEAGAKPTEVATPTEGAAGGGETPAPAATTEP